MIVYHVYRRNTAGKWKRVIGLVFSSSKNAASMVAKSKSDLQVRKAEV